VNLFIVKNVSPDGKGGEKMRKRIAAIDIGTSKICTIMASLDTSQGLKVQGIGLASARGVEKGLLTDLGSARPALQESIQEAEGKAGYKLDSAYVGISGNHVHSMSPGHNFALSRTDQIVHPEDLKGVLDMALNLKVLADRKLVQVVPSSSTLYGHDVRTRQNTSNFNLDLEPGFINKAMLSVQILNKCLMACGVESESLIVENVAAVEGVLGEDEKQAGTLLIDLGADTSSISVVKDGKVQQTGMVQVGGRLISSDVAAGFGISLEKAEQMKKMYGAVGTGRAEAGEDLQTEEGPISRQDLCDIIGARVEEILRLILLELGGRISLSGAVLTGGSARLPGLVEFTQEITGLPTRMGQPRFPQTVPDSILMDPAFGSSAGLIFLKMKNWSAYPRASERGGIQGFFASVGRLFA
jgi:cell division protein FtsA